MARLLSTGDVFAADYRIVSPLSKGGMGSLYVVDQLSTGKRRALKLMLSRKSDDPVARRRFVQEARVGALIASEHVVEVIAAGVEEMTDTPWLVMELLDGEDLRAYSDRAGPLPPAEVHELFEQLCHALAAAHAIPVVHRDLKPDNLFLARSRLAKSKVLLKILDFGIAKVVADEAGTTGSVGTPLWMAPEQSNPKVRISAATDVWSLGLIAFRLLTGKVFWLSAHDPTASTSALLVEILVDAIPAASARSRELGGHELPPGFDDWFARCVSRDPASRFPNAGEAWVALAPILGGEAGAASVRIPVRIMSSDDIVSPYQPTQESDPHPLAAAASATNTGTEIPVGAARTRRQPLVIGLSIAALVAVAASIGVMSMGSGRGAAKESASTPAPSASAIATAARSSLVETAPPPSASSPAPLVTSAASSAAPVSSPSAAPVPAASSARVAPPRASVHRPAVPVAPPPLASTPTAATTSRPPIPRDRE